VHCDSTASSASLSLCVLVQIVFTSVYLYFSADYGKQSECTTTKSIYGRVTATLARVAGARVVLMIAQAVRTVGGTGSDHSLYGMPPKLQNNTVNGSGSRRVCVSKSANAAGKQY
jgi:hypothetical protein